MMEFQHSQASHCESGVMSAICATTACRSRSRWPSAVLGDVLRLPAIVKINGLPLVSYRMPPKFIIKGLQKALGLKMRFETFRDPAAGTQRLNELLADGEVVGMQTSVFFLPYMPEDLRFHFNAHNVLAFGRDTASGDYQLSDPVFDAPVTCSPEALQKARFAKGALAPKGLLYYSSASPRPRTGPGLPKALKKRRASCSIHRCRSSACAASGGWQCIEGWPRRTTGPGQMFIGQVVACRRDRHRWRRFRFITLFLAEAAELLARRA